ncbi:MAG: VOC family protein [Candidatus Thorarchaeota archaeon]|jgi:predicted enzyme related to lactoylglutathione lyase
MPRVLHWEIVSDDPERTKKFYEEVFGWTITKWSGPMDYWNVRTGDPNKPGIEGGFKRRENPEEVTVNSIYVDDIDKRIELIKASGGEIVRPKFPVSGVGWLAYFKDTEGNLWGIMQDDPDVK